MIKLMHSGQTTQLFLIIDLHANFHSDSALYRDNGFQSDSSLYQGGTEWPSSPQHNDDLSPLNVILFSKIEALENKRVELLYASLVPRPAFTKDKAGFIIYRLRFVTTGSHSFFNV